MPSCTTKMPAGEDVAAIVDYLDSLGKGK